MNRRDFSKLSTTAALATLLPINEVAHAQQDKAQQDHDAAMQRHANLLGGPKLTIAMLAYPGMFCFRLTRCFHRPAITGSGRSFLRGRQIFTVTFDLQVERVR
jgi:hypothetical protein